MVTILFMKFICSTFYFLFYFFQLVSLFILTNFFHGETVEGTGGEGWAGGTMAWFSSIQWKKWQRRDITKESDQGDHHYVDWDALCSDFRQPESFHWEMQCQSVKVGKKKKRSKAKNKVHTKQTANVETVLRQPAGRRPNIWGGHPTVPHSHCPMPGQAVGPPVPSRHNLCWLQACCKATEGCGRRRA